MVSTPAVEQLAQSPCAELLAAAEGNLLAGRRAEAQRLLIARSWALEHRRLLHETPPDAPSGDGHVRRIGAISLAVWEYAPAELAVVWEIHPLAAQRLMADAVDLHDRLPHTWDAVHALRLDAWVARKIVALTSELSGEAAARVDEQICDDLASLPTGRLLAVVEGRVVAADPAAADERVNQARTRRCVHLSRPTGEGTRTLFARCDTVDASRVFETCDQIARMLAENTTSHEDPETLDQLRARALGLLADPQAALDFLAGRDPRRGKAVVYAHVSVDDPHLAGAARVEELGAHTRQMLVDLLGHDHITLTPVIDLNHVAPASDAYEIPTRIATRVRLLQPADTFPWAPSMSRTTDLDHTKPYDPGGPPGQTVEGNLAPLTRRHHRIKTHARGWHVQAQRTGAYLWTTPHGRQVLVDRHGTHPVRSLPEETLRALIDAAA